MIIETKDYTPEVLEKYYPRIKSDLERAIPKWLWNKAETGSTRSESGYQIIAANTTEKLAEILGCNPDKAKVICLAAGMYFPKYGHKGIEAVKEFITERNLDLDINTLGQDVAGNFISHGLVPMATNFYEVLGDYYSGKKSCPEVEIARFVQNTIIEIKKAEHFYEGHPGNLLFDVMTELCELAKETGNLTESRILEKYSEQIENCDFPKLTEEERKDIYETLERYVREFDDNERSFNYWKSVEEKVLTYFYLEPSQNF